MQSENIDYSSTIFKENFINRLRELWNEKKISAREMSISLGQNVNYINLIENGKRMPSMQGFFVICEFLEITPSEFFNKSQSITAEISEIISSLTLEQTKSVISLVKEFKK